MGPHKKSSETRGKSVKVSVNQSTQVQIIKSITMGKIHSRYIQGTFKVLHKVFHKVLREKKYAVVKVRSKPLYQWSPTVPVVTN